MVLRVVTFKVDEDFLREIDYYSEQLGLSRSEFIRLAIEKMIESLDVELSRNYVRETMIKTIVY